MKLIMIWAALLFAGLLSSCEKEETLPQGSKGQKWTVDGFEYWYDDCSCRSRPAGSTDPWYLYPSNNGSKNCSEYYTYPCSN